MSTSSMIRFSVSSCTIDGYITTTFSGLPKAFLTAHGLSSHGRADLADAVGRVVGECGDDSPPIRVYKNGGDVQTPSLPQIHDDDAVDAVVRIAGIAGPAGNERTNVIEQSLDVDILASNA
jgi:hypothetical protein